MLGVYDLKVDLDLTRPKNKMTFFQLSVNVTRDINGPARIVLYLPQLTHDSKHYSEVAGPYYDIHQGGPSTQTWREYDKTLTIYREGGWPYDNGSIAFQVADIESFTMNSMGVPYCDNTPCDNNIRMWIEGHDNSGSITTPLEITNIPKVPMIQRSSMRFSPSIFSANATLTVTLQLNMPAKPGDEFLFNLPGVDGLYVANNRNYTIVGDCGSISPDRFLYNNDSVLRLTVANTTDQCRGVNGSQNGLTYFNWTVPAEAGLTAPQIVNQINTELYQINWKQTLRYNSSMYMDTGFVPVADAPLAGFTSSGISFTSPYGGYASDMVLKILTADTLEVEDVITVYLPYINVTAGSTFTLTDSWGNIWHATWMEGVYTEAGATWSNNHHELALTVPQRMRPTALAFTVPVNLPVEGIEGGAPDMYAYDVGGNSTFTIGLTRGADSLQPQYIQYVQPVGSIYSVQINAIAEERTKPGGNDYNETAANNIGRKRVTFTLTLVTSGALNVGDEITIDMLAYDFNFDAALHVSTGTASFSARANAAERQIVITVTRAQSRETMRSGVSLTIDPSDSVQVPLHFCDANGSDCPLTLSIASSSCPVANFTTYAVNDYYTLFTKIHLHTAGGVPTLFPTSQPTGQPTSSPSSQPSGSPTMVPSGQPTSAPTSPTGQPTSRPSAQPSVQPTAVPSSQPSGQPTGEPSGQPTRQPTGSPTSSPTTALATSVRLNIEQDLEGISAADFDDADADAFIDGVVEASSNTLNINSGDVTIDNVLDVYNRRKLVHRGGRGARALSTASTCRVLYSINYIAEMMCGDAVNQTICSLSGEKIDEWVRTVVTSESFKQNFTTAIATRHPSTNLVNAVMSNASTPIAYTQTGFKSAWPTGAPTGQPTTMPSGQPTRQPSSQPSMQPTAQPSGEPTSQPTSVPSSQPSSIPSGTPTGQPSSGPSAEPSAQPSSQPTCQPTSEPTNPTGQPSCQPSSTPTGQPSCQPSSTCQPTSQPTSTPTGQPSCQPTSTPTGQPSCQPTSTYYTYGTAIMPAY